MYICEITSDDELDVVLAPAAATDHSWHSPISTASSSLSGDSADACAFPSTTSYASSQSPKLTATPLGHRISNPTGAVRSHPYQRRVLAHHKSVPGLSNWRGPSSLDDDSAEVAHRPAPLSKCSSALSSVHNNGNHTDLHSFSADGYLQQRRNSFSYTGEYSEEEQQQQEAQQQRQPNTAAAEARTRCWRSQASDDHSIASSSSSSLGVSSPSMTSRSSASDTDSAMHSSHAAAAPTPFSVDDILDSTSSYATERSSTYDKGTAYAMEARMAALTTSDRPRPRALSDAQRRAGNIMSPATTRSSHWGVVARRRGVSTSAKSAGPYNYENGVEAHFTASFAHLQQQRPVSPVPRDCRLDSVYEVTAKLERGLIDAAKVGIKLPTVPSSHKSLFYNTFSGML